MEKNLIGLPCSITDTEAWKDLEARENLPVAETAIRYLVCGPAYGAMVANTVKTVAVRKMRLPVS